MPEFIFDEYNVLFVVFFLYSSVCFYNESYGFDCVCAIEFWSFSVTNTNFKDVRQTRNKFINTQQQQQ